MKDFQKTIVFRDSEDLKDTMKAILMTLANQQEDSTISPYHLNRIALLLHSMIPEEEECQMRKSA